MQRQGDLRATSEDIRQLFRNADDHTVAAILAMQPTLAQLEEAAARAAGAGDILAGVRQEEGIVARIVDLVSAAEEEDEL